MSVGARVVVEWVLDLIPAASWRHLRARNSLFESLALNLNSYTLGQISINFLSCYIIKEGKWHCQFTCPESYFTCPGKQGNYEFRALSSSFLVAIGSFEKTNWTCSDTFVTILLHLWTDQWDCKTNWTCRQWSTVIFKVTGPQLYKVAGPTEKLQARQPENKLNSK